MEGVFEEDFNLTRPLFPDFTEGESRFGMSEEFDEGRGDEDGSTFFSFFPFFPIDFFLFFFSEGGLDSPSEIGFKFGFFDFPLSGVFSGVVAGGLKAGVELDLERLEFRLTGPVPRGVTDSVIGDDSPSSPRKVSLALLFGGKSASVDFFSVSSFVSLFSTLLSFSLAVVSWYSFVPSLSPKLASSVSRGSESGITKPLGNVGILWMRVKNLVC